MKTAVVIPACPGREENLQAVLESLRVQSREPAAIVVVEDGGRLAIEARAHTGVSFLLRHKHEPGKEQPRNAGVRWVRVFHPNVTHVWFLDSDVIVGEGALAELEAAALMAPDRATVVAPYDWMPPGQRAPMPELRNDPRWAMFRERSDEVMRADLSAGLACFSGNLLWSIDEFIRVGGFWSDLHHGRCEDGELGLRAVAMDVPIVLAPDARGWHLWHPINEQLVLERNRRDVPMLNDRHPWMVDRGVFMVDRDGKAFDVRCGCGEVVPTISWWAHAESCDSTGMAL